MTVIGNKTACSNYKISDSQGNLNGTNTPYVCYCAVMFLKKNWHICSLISQPNGKGNSANLKKIGLEFDLWGGNSKSHFTKQSALMDDVHGKFLTNTGCMQLYVLNVYCHPSFIVS